MIKLSPFIKCILYLNKPNLRFKISLPNKKVNALASKVWFTEDMLYVLLADGREIGVPLLWFPKLRKADKKQLKNWRFIGKGIGIHWEELDEDLSVSALLDG